VTSGSSIKRHVVESTDRNHYRTGLWLVVLLFPFLVGCEGCRTSNPNTKNDQSQSERLYQSQSIRTYPSDDDRPIGIKPSHWIAASQRLKSTASDARGEFTSRIKRSRTDRVGAEEDLRVNREVILPRGQWREVDFRLLPQQSDRDRANFYFVDSQLKISGQPVELPGMRRVINNDEILKSQEYFFLIFTTRPERFTGLQRADWVRFQSDPFRVSKSEPNFRVITISDNRSQVPFPETMLDLTATGVILWDDLPIEIITPRQQLAISDWIRFGGLLVLNGAAPSEALSFSALADLVPMEMESRVELDFEEAKNLLLDSTVPNDSSLEKQIAVLGQYTGGISFVGKLKDDANYVMASNNLLVRLPAGRGHVIQSRFDLTSDWITNWQSFDSFFNSAILGRPRRAIRVLKDEFDEPVFTQYYPDQQVEAADPTFNTRFRIIARDAKLSASETEGQLSQEKTAFPDPFTAVDPVSGISGWRHDSDFIRFGADVLRERSSIRVPEAATAMVILFSYLIVLIPINYILFRLINRLEWFWLATPVIAIAGVVVVAYAIQLDIGFARSRHELSLLEVHGNYSRAHLTRLVAVYNSLSTNYEIDFASSDVSIEPTLGGEVDVASYPSTLKLERTGAISLDDFLIRSNQARVLRVEQMIELGGSIVLSADDRINNQSDLHLRDGMVIRRKEDGRLEKAILGDLGSSQQAILKFELFDETGVSDLELQSQEELLNSLATGRTMPRGAAKLVALYDGAIDGMNTQPPMDQQHGQTLVVVHLGYANWPAPIPDVNLMTGLVANLSRDQKTTTINEPSGDLSSND